MRDQQYYVLCEIERNYHSFVSMLKKMEDPGYEKCYNPEHPACWSKVQKSVHPAGEMEKFAIQLAIEAPYDYHTSKLSVPSKFEWDRLSIIVKEVKELTKTRNINILSFTNKWDFVPWFQKFFPSRVSNKFKSIEEKDANVAVVV